MLASRQMSCRYTKVERRVKRRIEHNDTTQPTPERAAIVSRRWESVACTLLRSRLLPLLADSCWRWDRDQEVAAPTLRSFFWIGNSLS